MIVLYDYLNTVENYTWKKFLHQIVYENGLCLPWVDYKNGENDRDEMFVTETNS